MIICNCNAVFDPKQIFIGNDDVAIKLVNHAVYSRICFYGTFGPNKATILTDWVTWFPNDFLTLSFDYIRHFNYNCS